ncbi:MAG TPA: hypothetical protein VLE49_04590 [Anaerolineales bacterium]|nr:hypothetical protein [Anaerolineales bacterium]
MAKAKRNMVVRGISGTVGKDLVFRQMRDGSTIVSGKPDFSHRVFSHGQLTHQSRFQQAAAYARAAAKTNPIYTELAQGTTKTAYNIALSDWFNPPVIHESKCQNGHILVNATDNVLVTRVLVTILDEEGEIREKGEGIRAEGDWWEYVSAREGRVRVEAWDLAGNVARREI